MISLRRRRREQERREPSEKPRLQTTAHARRSSSTRLCVLRLPHKRQAGSFLYSAPAKRKPAAPTRAAAPPGGSVYCACHAKGSQAQEALCTAPRRKPAAGQRRPCAPQLLQEALCTAPATRKAARKLSILHRPCESQPRASGAHARRNSCRHTTASRGPAAPTCAAAPPGDSVYCTCHTKGSQEAPCTAPACHPISGVVKSGE